MTMDKTEAPITTTHPNHEEQREPVMPVIRAVSSHNKLRIMRSFGLVTTVVLILGSLAYRGTSTSMLNHFLVSFSPSHNNRRLEEESSSKTLKGGRWIVFLTISEEEENSRSTHKYIQDLKSQPGLGEIHMVSSKSLEEGTSWLQNCSVEDLSASLVEKRYREFMAEGQSSLAAELIKYCALISTLNKQQSVIWLDASSPWLWSLHSLLEQVNQNDKPVFNVAVLGDRTHSITQKTIHGSFLAITSAQKPLAQELLHALVSSSMSDVVRYPLFVPRTLHDAIESQVTDESLRVGSNSMADSSEKGGWFLLEQECLFLTPSTSGATGKSYRPTPTTWCPLANGGYCCRVLLKSETVLLTRHPILPSLNHHSPLLNAPFNSGTMHYKEQDLPYIAMLREEIYPKPEGYESKNMFEILMANQCLPDSVECARCLRAKTGANCQKCAVECSCYCKALCKVDPDPKHVAKKIFVTPPNYARDPTRLIPRIIHQTYFEELTQDNYPNMSRMVESFKRSGWDYRFYSDEDAQNFLSTHFPPEVRQAYDMLRPGAFKADLFRYCALLITGGVYADVDIILESNLDESIPFDAGFVVPVDEPGSEAGVRMCVWNGLIGATPAHPFLVHVVQTVVNQVRNRFTSVDVDATFCPNPELSVLHAFDTLFTAGPCALGAAMNRVLGRAGQTSFEAGELNPGKVDHNIPGRSIILHQNKWDMGGHRFTLLEQNLIVAATDLPDSDDRAAAAAQEGVAQKTEHYSKTHASVGIYGLELLYVDGIPSAQEEVHFEIVKSTTGVVAAAV